MIVEIAIECQCGDPEEGKYVIVLKTDDGAIVGHFRAHKIIAQDTVLNVLFEGTEARNAE